MGLSMFLKCLDAAECEERFWPFVFRLETVLYGVVSGAAERLAGMEPDERILFLYDSLGASMDRRDKAIPENWWPEPAPSLEWFDDYLRKSLDALGAEAVRLAALDPAARQTQAQSAFDKKKVRECAHLNEAFRKFLLPNLSDAELTSGHDLPPDHTSDR